MFLGYIWSIQDWGCGNTAGGAALSIKLHRLWTRSPATWLTPSGPRRSESGDETHLRSHTFSRTIKPLASATVISCCSRVGFPNLPSQRRDLLPRNPRHSPPHPPGLRMGDEGLTAWHGALLSGVWAASPFCDLVFPGFPWDAPTGFSSHPPPQLSPQVSGAGERGVPTPPQPGAWEPSQSDLRASQSGWLSASE